MENVLVFGGSSTVLSTSYDPVLSSWKTSQQSLFEDYQQSLEALPKSGMTVSGRLYLLNNVEHPTLEDDGLQSRIPAESQTEQGLLPTPTKTGSEHRTRYSQGGRPLMYMIQKTLLPTPTASDAGPAAILNENTNIVFTGKGTPRKVSNNGVNGSLGLARTVMLLPTPSAHEHKYRLKGNSQASKCLEARARRTGKDFQLNPRFVEEMMGFPIGWTELNHSETQSSHSALNGLDNK
tara:strand:+ start:373 stop:1080 length:708 start_codon:yes stop_codon:yes gene_type:complete